MPSNPQTTSERYVELRRRKLALEAIIREPSVWTANFVELARAELINVDAEIEALAPSVYRVDHAAAVKALADSIIRDIRADDGLDGALNFAGLHDLCDANTLGATEFVFEAFRPDGPAIIDEAQKLVDAWLRAGRPGSDAEAMV
jgi:hypothetical protein